MIGRLLTQLGLDGVERVPIENGGLFAMGHLTLEWHLTDIDLVFMVRTPSLACLAGRKISARSSACR